MLHNVLIVYHNIMYVSKDVNKHGSLVFSA